MKSLKFCFPLFLFLSLVNFGFSQENSSDKILRFGIELDASATNVYHSAFEASSFSFAPAFGARLDYQINKYFFLYVGLKYSRTGIKNHLISSARWPSQHDGDGGFDPTIPVFIEGSFSQVFEFVELPIGLMLPFGQKENFFYIKPSVAPVFQIGSDLDFFEDAFDRNLSFNGQLGFGYSFNLKSFSFLVEPYFKSSITEVDLSVFGEAFKHYQFGLSVGALFNENWKKNK